MFQSTLPRRERLIATYNCRIRNKFQSTLPRRERPFRKVRIYCSNTVSIHAPTKGATICLLPSVPRSSGFNPRSHEGSDFVKSGMYCEIAEVSIHAPTKGATFIDFCSEDGTIVSIHAPTKGATCFSAKGFPAVPQFQSTLPRRERLLLCASLHGILAVSIHAPTKGATPSAHSRSIRFRCFNPRSHEGSDDSVFETISWQNRFNPRSHEGSDLPWLDLPRKFPVSIHAPTKGATFRSV